MTTRGISVEQYNEEFSRLDQELKLLQKELDDTLQLNDNYQKSIEQKGDELAAKDEYLLTLKEKNAAEIEQLKLEEASAKDSSVHEVNFHTVELQNLTIRRQRLQELKNENKRLRSSLKFLEEQTKKDRLDHALAMHEMNKEMKSLRQQMEQSLRKELAGLELSFQEKAFCVLQDKQKKAMLENAKLKDEVALQGVGIANLTARLIKQQLAYEKCEKVLNKHEQKSQLLRERLAQATMLKNTINEKREALLREEQELLQQQQQLTQQLHVTSSSTLGTVLGTISGGSALSTARGNASPRKKGTSKFAQTTVLIDELVTRYASAKDQYRSLLNAVKLWVQRYDQIKNIFIDLKPLDHAEKNGNYRKKHFPLKELMEETTEYILQQSIIDPDIPAPIKTSIHTTPTGKKFSSELKPVMESENSSVTNNSKPSLSSQGSEVVLEIRKLIQQDPDLAEALKLLRGKESSLLTAFQGSTERKKPGIAEKDGSGLVEDMNKEEEKGDDENQIENEKDQNMIAWTVLRIINLWFGTQVKLQQEQLEDIETEVVEEQLIVDPPTILDPLQRTSSTPNLTNNPPSDYLPDTTEQISLSDHYDPKHLETVDQNSSPLQVDLDHTGFNSAFAETKVGEKDETMGEWEQRMMEEIAQARIEDAHQILSNMKVQETGINYVDQPPETGSWLFKPPPRYSKHKVFADKIRDKLLPKVYSVSVKERLQHSKDQLQLTDIGPPVVIHDFLSPISAPQAFSPSSRSRQSSPLAASSPDGLTNSQGSFFQKPKFQRKESQLIHYDADRDPLLFNQKKKHLTLPKSPKRLNSTDAEESQPHSIYKKKYVSDRSLPRKLVIALSKTTSGSTILPDKPLTPGLNPSLSSNLPLPANQKTSGTTSNQNFDAFFHQNKNQRKNSSVLSHSTGALLGKKKQ